MALRNVIRVWLNEVGFATTSSCLVTGWGYLLDFGVVSSFGVDSDGMDLLELHTIRGTLKLYILYALKKP